MSAKTATQTPKPDPEVAKLEAAKAQFAEAVKKTNAAEGVTPEKAKAAPEPAPAAKAEEPKPAPKPKPTAKPKPHAPDLSKQIAALEAKIEALSKAPKQEEPEEDPLDGIRGKLAERFGEEESGALIEALEALHAPSAKRIAELERVLQEATKSGRQSISKANQKRLAQTYPQLANEAAWSMIHESVLAEFDKNPSAYASAEEAYDAKAEALYGAPEQSEETPEEEPQEDDEALASRIAASSMTAPEKKPRATPKSALEKAKEVFLHLKKNPEDKAGARRLARELRTDR